MKRLYVTKDAGETATLSVLDANGKPAVAKLLILAAELAAGGASGLIYDAYGADTPVESQGPGFTPGGYLYDDNACFSTAKFLIGTGGSDVILTLAIRGEDDISGSTLV
jgi:hypothetical protein